MLPLLHLVLRGSHLDGKIPSALSNELILRWASMHCQVRLLEPTQATPAPGGGEPGLPRDWQWLSRWRAGFGRGQLRPGRARCLEELAPSAESTSVQWLPFPHQSPQTSDQPVSSRSATGASSSHPYPWHLGEAPWTPERWLCLSNAQPRSPSDKPHPTQASRTLLPV